MIIKAPWYITNENILYYWQSWQDFELVKLKNYSNCIVSLTWPILGAMLLLPCIRFVILSKNNNNIYDINKIIKQRSYEPVAGPTLTSKLSYRLSPTKHTHRLLFCRMHICARVSETLSGPFSKTLAVAIGNMRMYIHFLYVCACTILMKYICACTQLSCYINVLKNIYVRMHFVYPASPFAYEWRKGTRKFKNSPLQTFKRNARVSWYQSAPAWYHSGMI